MLTEYDDIALKLLLHAPRKLIRSMPRNAQIVISDVSDAKLLQRIAAGQDTVHASLAGELGKQAKRFATAMHRAGVEWFSYHHSVQTDASTSSGRQL